MLESLVEWTMPAAYVTQYTGRAASPRRCPPRFCRPLRRLSGGRRQQRQPGRPERRAVASAVPGRPGAAWLAEDPRFSTNERRLANREVLEPLIESLLADQTRASVEARLTRADVPFGTVNDMDDVLRHPQLEARGRWFDIPSPSGTLRAFHHPLNIEGIPRPALRRARPGRAHAGNVLAEPRTQRQDDDCGGTASAGERRKSPVVGYRAVAAPRAESRGGWLP